MQGLEQKIINNFVIYRVISTLSYVRSAIISMRSLVGFKHWNTILGNINANSNAEI